MVEDQLFADAFVDKSVFQRNTVKFFIGVDFRIEFFDNGCVLDIIPPPTGKVALIGGSVTDTPSINTIYYTSNTVV